jgi:hypothetical protein
MVTAQVFASANAKGASNAVLTTYIDYTYNAEPYVSFKLYNTDTNTEMDDLDGAVINISSTPRVAVLLDAWGARFRWWPESARIVYDKNVRVVVEWSTTGLSWPHWRPVFALYPKRGKHSLSACDLVPKEEPDESQHHVEPRILYGRGLERARQDHETKLLESINSLSRIRLSAVQFSPG